MRKIFRRDGFKLVKFIDYLVCFNVIRGEEVIVRGRGWFSCMESYNNLGNSN